MDRNRYQPWLYYYPSGFRLYEVADTLNEIVKRLHKAYEFNTLYVTAHSMGGLVSRAFILKNVYVDKQDYIKLFISISTPWGGHKMAAKGVEGAPAAIPSWHDMVPKSKFIQSIYQKDFTADIKYFLLFSFRGNCSLFMKNNDGSVELSSELDYRAQASADGIIGFDEDHVSILDSSKVLNLYYGILDGGQVKWK